MRKLADALDVKPMSLYHHVANKEAILDGMVDSCSARSTRRPPTCRGATPWPTAADRRARCCAVTRGPPR